MVFTPTLKHLNELRWHLVFHLDKIGQTIKPDLVAPPMKPGQSKINAVKGKQRKGMSQ